MLISGFRKLMSPEGEGAGASGGQTQPKTETEMPKGEGKPSGGDPPAKPHRVFSTQEDLEAFVKDRVGRAEKASMATLAKELGFVDGSQRGDVEALKKAYPEMKKAFEERQKKDEAERSEIEKLQATYKETQEKLAQLAAERDGYKLMHDVLSVAGKAGIRPDAVKASQVLYANYRDSVEEGKEILEPADWFEKHLKKEMPFMFAEAKPAGTGIAPTEEKPKNKTEDGATLAEKMTDAEFEAFLAKARYGI